MWAGFPNKIRWCSTLVLGIWGWKEEREQLHVRRESWVTLRGEVIYSRKIKAALNKPTRRKLEEYTYCPYYPHSPPSPYLLPGLPLAELTRNQTTECLSTYSMQISLLEQKSSIQKSRECTWRVKLHFEVVCHSQMVPETELFRYLMENPYSWSLWCFMLQEFFSPI